MTPLETEVRVALKMKWMNSDYDIDMEKMSDYFNQPKEVLEKIIHDYESELLATKFNLIWA
jgi:uncharacterized membrane-anchored protein YhcB (DUF1043 family)